MIWALSISSVDEIKEEDISYRVTVITKRNISS